MNKYPLWKNLLLIAVLIVAALYALPNVFFQDPAVQISSTTPGIVLSQDLLQTVTTTLKSNKLPYKSASVEKDHLLIRFSDIDTQLQAKELLKKTLGDQYIVAIDLASAAPEWLSKIGAHQVKLGLDLRGGVHFLLQIDLDSVMQRRLKGDVHNIEEELRNKRIRYTGIAPQRQGQGLMIRFRDAATLQKAQSVLANNFSEFKWEAVKGTNNQLSGKLVPNQLQKIGQYAVEQTMTTLRHRVNELGVSEALVQQQGQNRISIDLPGVQDATQAKDILGKTATLEFHMVDTEHDAASAAAGGLIPPGTSLYNYNGRPYLLKNQIILSGDSITNAESGFDPTTGQPMVGIKLGGGGESLFERITAENVGKPIATVYIDLQPHTTKINGKEKITYKKKSRVINIATIQSALGNNFQVTGLSSPQEANQLALLLRSGALPAVIAIIEEKTVGPSMGQRNIHQGMLSVEIGLLLVVIFMIIYYRFFGLVADIGLLVNMIFLIAILSAINATLTFAGIAGIVLTVGMAVDANVLIYERIREELRNGMTPQAAIHAGYERAFITIVDANVTTLIVAMILFALGTGSVKGFAITLTIGLMTSMLSAIMYTRAIVNWRYGGKRVKSLSIGIKVEKKAEEAKVK
ncbi:MAG: protein translocase subunit SecD [Gammaproteobacteria bacterium]|jgi:preprotein translocase subunit SecD